MHIGNLRTALFAYLFAKSMNGKFILRIEDTDQGRYVEGATDVIYSTLRTAGLIHDEGPDIGGPYGPYTQSERKGMYRQYAEELVAKGEITVENSTLDDQVLLKSDGMPTYNFANVVDDHLMHITHIIRGSEYLSSNPKYLLLYKAFGWEAPEYIHLPLINGKNPDGTISKLSKRHGAVSFQALLEQGYIPEGTALESKWEKTASLLQSRIGKMSEIPEKTAFLHELPDYSTELFINKKNKSTLETSAAILKKAANTLSTVDDWSEEVLLDTVTGMASEAGLKIGPFTWPIRIALSGLLVTPGGAIDLLYILGKEESLRRITKAIEKI